MIVLRTKKFDSGEVSINTIPGGEQTQLSVARQGLNGLRNYHQKTSMDNEQEQG